MFGALPTSRKLVIADPGTCIGCKTCMAACLMRHDTKDDIPIPRLTLVTTRAISAPVGCHHCAEAPCVDACPIGCLFSDDEHVGVSPGKCIGCRNCVLACPYGAIDIVTRVAVVAPESARGQTTAESPAQDFAGSAASAPVPDKAKLSARDRVREKAKKRRSTVSTVVKCDLCLGCGRGPACVSACPTKALRLIDPATMERGKQAKQKSAARAAAAYSSLTLNANLNEEG